MSLVTHGLLLGKQRKVTVGTTVSTQKLMYPVMQSVRSSRSSPCESQSNSQSVCSKQPCKSSMVSCDHLLTVLVVTGSRWTWGLYRGCRWMRLWSDLPSGGRAVELYASLTLAYSRSSRSSLWFHVSQLSSRQHYPALSPDKLKLIWRSFRNRTTPQQRQLLIFL